MSEPIAPGSWCRIAQGAIWDRQLSRAAFKVLAALGVYADDFGRCWPSVGALSLIVGVDVRHVRRHLRELEGRGWISTRQRKRRIEGGYSSNGYQLHFRTPPPKPVMVRNDEDEGDGHPPSLDGSKRTGGAPDAIATDRAPAAPSADCDDQDRTDNRSEAIGRSRAGDRAVPGSDRAESTKPPGRSPPYELAQRTNPTNKNPPSTAHPRASAREGGAAVLSPQADANGREDAQQDERLGLAGVPKPDLHGGLTGEERRWSERFAAAQGDVEATREVSLAYLEWLDDQAERSKSITTDIFGANT